MIPTIGRIVHFHKPDGNGGKVVKAAVITGVYSRDPDGNLYLAQDGVGLEDVTQVDLKVLHQNGSTDLIAVEQKSESCDVSCWSWPPIVHHAKKEEAEVTGAPKKSKHTKHEADELAK